MRVDRCVYRSDMPKELRELLDSAVAGMYMDPEHGDTVIHVDHVICDGNEGGKFEDAFCDWCEGNGVQPDEIALIFLS